MRSFDQLVVLDFPHVDSETFEEWKQAGIESSRNHQLFWGIWCGAVVAITLLANASNYIPAFIIIAVLIPLQLIVRFIVNMKFNQLSKELGITKDMIDKALKTDSFEFSLTKPEIIETPKKYPLRT